MKRFATLSVRESALASHRARIELLSCMLLLLYVLLLCIGPVQARESSPNDASSSPEPNPSTTAMHHRKPLKTFSAPAISAVRETPTTVHNGDTVRWDVRTTPNVVSVDAHVTLATLPLRRAAPGHFTLAFVVPADAPGFFHGSYTIDIVAKADDGETVTKTIGINFR